MLKNAVWKASGDGCGEIKQMCCWMTAPHEPTRQKGKCNIAASENLRPHLYHKQRASHTKMTLQLLAIGFPMTPTVWTPFLHFYALWSFRCLVCAGYLYCCHFSLSTSERATRDSLTTLLPLGRTPPTFATWWKAFEVRLFDLCCHCLWFSQSLPYSSITVCSLRIFCVLKCLGSSAV